MKDLADEKVACDTSIWACLQGSWISVFALFDVPWCPLDCPCLCKLDPRIYSQIDLIVKWHSQASQLLNHALFLAVTFGVAVCILMEALAPQLLKLMGTGPEYLKPALVYLRIRALSGTSLVLLVTFFTNQIKVMTGVNLTNNAMTSLFVVVQ